MTAPSSTWFTLSPEWGWLIVLYFFFGGLAGGCYFLSALVDLFGRPQDRPLARVGYLAVLPLLLICGVLLIVDLTRPERFWHLLLENHTLQPMFKFWSPMSIGSWMLLAFGFFASLSFVGALAESGRISWRAARRLRPPGIAGKTIAALGALFSLYIAGYSGVLIEVTNRPIWSDTPLLGTLFILSAASISAALLALLAQRSHRDLPAVAALHRINVWLLALQLLALIAILVSLGPVARAWLNAWGVLLALAVAAGMAAPLALLWRREHFGNRAMIAAALVLAGGFTLRTVIVLSSESI